jgi:hemolysin activation/secretion protein
MQALERQLLLLNDIPGVSFQSTLEPIKNQDDPAVRLILTGKKTTGVTTVSIDNGGSRYIGPYEISAAWSGSLLPLQQTDLSAQYTPAFSSTGGNLYSVNATHKMLLSTATSLDVTGGFSNAVPGYTLKSENIVSQSANGGIGFSYHLMRQRDENLTTRVSMDFRDSASDILNTILSRDRIRAVNIGLSYDRADALFGNNYPGHNNLDIAFRRGLPVIDSNSVNDSEASRPDTSPDFTKLTASYNRLQSLTQNFSGALSLSGQKSAQSLYSSEEFGYGGMAVGRAYDTSEISGDSGISGSLEIRYHGLLATGQTTLMPYFFYDIGKVWNYSTGQPGQISAASAGPGMRFQCTSGLSGNLYIARPLTKTVSTLLTGGDGTVPRFVFQLSDKF